MASPTFGDIGTFNTAAGTPRTPGVPANTVNGSFIVVLEGISSSGDRTGITSGGNGTWAELVKSLASRGSYMVDWKVIGTAGSEGATYSVPAHASLTGKTYALRLAGVDPITPFHATQNFADASSAATAAVSLASLPECLLIWVWQSQGSGASSAISAVPTVGGTPMIQRSSGSQFMHVCTLEYAGGSTGSITGTMSTGPLHRVMLLAVLPPGGTFSGAADAVAETASITSAGVVGKSTSASLTATATITAAGSVSVPAGPPVLVNWGDWEDPPGSSAAVDLPSSLVTGNLLVACIACEGTLSASGWTSVTSGADDQSLAWRRVDGSEGSTATFTASGGVLYAAQVLQISGAIETGDPIDVWTSAHGLSSTTTAAISVTTTVDHTLLGLHVFTPSADRTVTADPSGMTAIDGAVNQRSHVFTGPQSTAGASGSKQATINSANNNDTLLFAILPGASASDFNGTASRTTTATITATGVVGRSTTASLTETANRTATGSTGVSKATTALTETATINSTGSAGVSKAATALALTAAITAAGVVGTATTASLTETATVTATGSRNLTAATPLTVTAGITAAGQVGKSTTAALSVTATTTSTGVVGRSGTTTLPVVATLTAAGQVGASSTADLAITATTAASGTTGASVESPADPTVITATITSTGQFGGTGAATLDITATTDAAGLMDRSDTATLPVAADLIAAGQVGISGTATLDTTATVITAGANEASIDSPAHETVVTATITSTGEVGITGLAALGITTTTSGTGRIDASGASSLTIITATTATGSVGKVGAANLTVTANRAAAGGAYIPVEAPRHARARIVTPVYDATITSAGGEARITSQTNAKAVLL